MSPVPNLVLIGFMATGKSTVGRACARELGFEFRDSDTLIERRAGKSISAIFAEDGEAAFREMEAEAIRDLSRASRIVLATGGGAPMNPANVACLRRSGIVVLLWADPEEIMQRAGTRLSRPLLAGAPDPRERIVSLLAEREPAYRAAAHVVIDSTGLTRDEAAARVLSAYRERKRAEFTPLMSALQVSLGPRSYPIVIESGLLNRAAKVILDAAPTTSAAVLSHPRLAALYAEPLMSGLRERGVRAHLIRVPAGERYKSLATVARLYDALLDAGMDRKSLLITLGGGVLGDVGGFVAATYLRGIPFVQIPTTLLAQVDASVGGKTGVDLPRGKNLVGAFHQPRAVLVDTDTLHTLPARELRSGLAEVIKYGIICDEGFFARLKTQMPRLLQRDSVALSEAIRRSCEIKAEVVGKDETEQGLRAVLNFGHTVGHALEAVTGYRRYKHGEAIAIGMVSASLIGEEVGVTPPDVTRAISELLAIVKLPTAFPADVPDEPILEAMGRDKKRLAGKLHFVLATRIGEVILKWDVPESAVRAALKRQRAGSF